MDTQIQTDAFSEDLLKSFRSSLDSESRIGSGEEEVELTLGLSLNGRFGVDPMAPKLARSSSIPEYMNPSAPRDTSAVAVAAAATAARHVFPAVASGSLKRTCSLPVEPEEEVRKRKEMQSFRRMEAKRKRTEKQRNLIFRAAAKDSIDRKGSIPVPLKLEKRVSKGSSSEKLRNHSQGPVVSSQGSSSDPESQIIEGMSRSGAELRSPETKGQTLSDQMESEANSEAGIVRWPSLGTGMKNQFNKLSVSDNSPVTMDMPCVSTQGDGPEGKRIKGFLYRYSKSEEVRIVCFCHGSILSPAEFVQHAGGTDVEKPLKHIVVTPSSFSI